MKRRYRMDGPLDDGGALVTCNEVGQAEGRVGCSWLLRSQFPAWCSCSVVQQRLEADSATQPVFPQA